MTKAQMVLETLVCSPAGILTRLLARDRFIEKKEDQDYGGKRGEDAEKIRIRRL
jgi:hypothetical protein